MGLVEFCRYSTSFKSKDSISQTYSTIFLKYNTKCLTFEQRLNICKLSSIMLHLLHNGEATCFILKSLNLVVKIPCRCLNNISLSFKLIYLKFKLCHVDFQLITILL